MARLSGDVVVYFWMCLCISAALTSGWKAERTKERRVGKINCISYVFHPKCRGTAAKRAPLATRGSSSPENSDAEQNGETSYDTNAPLASIAHQNGLVMDRDIAVRLLDSLPSSRAKIPIRTDVSPARNNPSDMMAIADEAVAQPDTRTHRTPDADATSTWEESPSVASRYGWVLFRKRAKEQELTYDY